VTRQIVAYAVSTGKAWFVSLNLSPDRQEEAKAKGIEPFRKRLAANMSPRFGCVPPYFAALDVDRKKRIHIHAVIVANDNEIAAVRKALRAAGGKWAKQHGKQRQLKIIPLGTSATDINRLSSYLVRNHGRREMKRIGGRLTACSNSLTPRHHPVYGPQQDGRKRPRKLVIISRQDTSSKCPPALVF
tara:strand:+ start:6407 stop:6967 length:561 start_codon:yes stop_codon:yes gene_type:complete